MTEHQRTHWTICAPISAAYNYAMQDFTDTVFTRSEQHKEATPLRMERDRTDIAKLAMKPAKHSPFSEGKALQNIITGINTDMDVNVQDLFNAGKETVTQMEGQAIFSYTNKRKAKVKTLAASRTIKITEDQTIDPALLFQRFLVISQSGEFGLDEVLHYELSPHPPSLFEAKVVLRKPDKAQLLEAIREYLSSSKAPKLEAVPKTDHYVLDGGSPLQRLKWKEGSTYIDQLLRCMHRSLWIIMARPLLSLMDILEDQVQKTIPINDGAPKLQIRLIYQLQHKLLEK